MQLSIFSREKPLFSGEVKSVSLPGTWGPFQILKAHAPFVGMLVKGEVVYEKVNGEKVSAMIERGSVRVENNKVVLLLVSPQA